MPRVLVVAYYFPPLGGIGSVRVSSFAKHLADYGWSPTVLAPHNGAYYRDPETSFPEELIVRTPSIELSRIGKRALGAGGDDARAAEISGGALAAARWAARSLLYFPDAQVGWYPPAVLTALTKLRRAHFDAIFSSSFPVTAHLIARTLHRTWGIPWVAEFRDPWSQALPRESVTRRRAVRLERRLAEDADALVMTSPTWADMHAREWGRPVTVIPNGHGGSPPPAPSSNGEFVLTYLGTFYPETQRLDAVLDAIAALRRNGEAGVDRLRFVGSPPPNLLRQLHERALDPIVEVTGFVPHAQAMSELARSSALLLAGPVRSDDIQRGVVAAKVAEYLATDLPIIYLGVDRCDIADLLRQYPGCHLVDTVDVAGVVDALRASRGRRHAREADALSRHQLTGRLAALLEQVTSCAS